MEDSTTPYQVSRLLQEAFYKADKVRTTHIWNAESQRTVGPSVTRRVSEDSWSFCPQESLRGQLVLLSPGESQRDSWSFCPQESLKGTVGPSVPRRVSKGQYVLLSPGESQRDSWSFCPQESLRGTVGPSVPWRVRKYSQTKGPTVPLRLLLCCLLPFQKDPFPCSPYKSWH